MRLFLRVPQRCVEFISRGDSDELNLKDIDQVVLVAHVYCYHDTNEMLLNLTVNLHLLSFFCN